MAYFPQFLASKAQAQFPLNSAQMFETVEVSLPSGPRHAYARYGAGLTNFPTLPLYSWTKQLRLTDAELSTLRSFFQSVYGPLEEFIYLDPGGNLLQYGENFSVSEWSKTSVTVGAAVSDPFGGTRATVLTASSSDSSMYSVVLPSGNASGFLLNASVYVKPLSSSGSMRIGFIDGSLSLLASVTTSIPTANQWYRISCPITLATSSSIRVMIGGAGTWNATTMHVFGAMCAPLPGQGSYVTSPANWGYHAKCRFDMPDLTWQKTGPNMNQVSLRIQEYF